MVGQIKRKNHLKIAFYIVVAVLVGIFICYQFYPTPSKTVRQFFTYLMREEYEKAYNLIDGSYKEKRGSLEKFSSEYRQAVESGTRTKGVRITGIEKTGEPNKVIVDVTVRALYFGDLIDTNGRYLVEKIRGKGWRIIDNVSLTQNK
ncbi:MAG TPA: hypothetical protein PLD35_05455 [Caldisericia bacterium]|nr:hypothetical protein [Caldisericia bacterium]HPO29437.1 hypothetical protein [Caldisericia bacterium]